MKPFPLLLLLFITACGAKSSSVKYGKTTVADLIQEKGEPTKKEAIPIKGSSVLYFNDKESYQIKDDIVTNGFITPQKEERSLLYWKHHFKDCQTILKKLPRKADSHGPLEYELACPEEGRSIIYSEGSEFISRIVEYESK